MGPNPPDFKGGPPRRLRPGSSSSPESNSTRKKTRSSQSPTKQRRFSKARKSLNFDNEPVPKRGAAMEDSQALSRFPTLFRRTEDSEETKTRRIPPLAHFWANPPPPPSETASAQIPNPLEESAGTASQPQRRSERLIRKGLSIDSQDKDSCFPPDEPDSGLGASFSSCASSSFSQSTFIPFTGFKCPPVDALSVHSDYGTSSENSFNLGNRKRKHMTRQSFNRGKRTCILQNDLASGYASDIDEGIESYHEVEPSQGWDSDDEERARLTAPTKLVDSQPQEWDQAIQDEQLNSSLPPAYMNISNLSAPVDIGVKWLSSQGTHVVIPLEGYEFPQSYRPTLPPSPGSSISELVREFSPSPYETRKRSRYRPKPVMPASPFEIRTFPGKNVAESFRKIGLRLLAASPVISLEPKGTKFCEFYPAVISIPMETVPALGDEIYCLYSDDPKVEEEFGHETDPCLTWSVLHNVQITLEGGRITFETYEFSSFIIVVRERSPEAHKQIRARIGGRLHIPEVPGAEINFSKGSVLDDATIRSKIFIDTEMSLPDFLRKGKLVRNQESPFTLATPILMMEPHGIAFEPDLVTIQLPVPDYDKIVELFGPLARLRIMQSCTEENEPTRWEVVDVEYEITKIRSFGSGQHPITVVSFKVSHFSFFKVVWDIISASLYEARVGMSYFHNFVAFSMKCQANMEESCDNRFALEITCYRSDKRFPEFTNYRHRVGCSSKPKNVRPGKIFVRLKSSYFDADLDAGEDELKGLEKVEDDFRGRDFAMQYCCKFKSDKQVEHGPFGKVIVHRFVKAGQEELLFEFNLQKSGHEGERTPHEQSDRWSILALKELAASLFITDGENWKSFATHIGFTKQEIKTNFKNAPEPFVAIINLYQNRGGTPDEFVQALYAVNRELKINSGLSPTSSRKSRSSNCSSGRGSMTLAKNQQLSDSDTSGTQISQDSLLTGTTRKRSNPSLNRSGNGSSNKSKRKSRKRRKVVSLSESEDELTSSEREESSSCSDTDAEDLAKGNSVITATSGNNSSINLKNDMMKLEATFLWEISASMDGLNWRALGRTLGIQESILLNTEHTHRVNGFRECAYQMLLVWKEKFPKKCTFGVLYCALCKEGMNAVAKKMIQVRRND